MVTGRAKQKIRDIEKYGRTVRGRGELILHHKEHKINEKQAIWGKCYDCCGYYEDSRGKTFGFDCKCEDCPLYPFMPFRNQGGVSDVFV